MPSTCEVPACSRVTIRRAGTPAPCSSQTAFVAAGVACGATVIAAKDSVDALVALCCKSRVLPRRRPYASSIRIAMKGPEMTRVSGVAAV